MWLSTPPGFPLPLGVRRTSTMTASRMAGITERVVELISGQQLLRNNPVLDGRCAFFQPVESGVAVESLDRVSAGITDAAEDQQCPVRDAADRFQSKLLAHGGLG